MLRTYRNIFRIAWFQKVSKEHYINQLVRPDAMKLFAAGRGEELNQKSINTVCDRDASGHARCRLEHPTLQARLAAGLDKRVEIYEREELTRLF